MTYHFWVPFGIFLAGYIVGIFLRYFFNFRFLCPVCLASLIAAITTSMVSFPLLVPAFFTGQFTIHFADDLRKNLKTAGFKKYEYVKTIATMVTTLITLMIFARIFGGG